MAAVFLEFILANAIDLFTALIATIGVGLWFLDRRALRSALHATKTNELTSLRLKKQDREAKVDREFARLQINCRATREEWEKHKHGLVTLGSSMFDTPTEVREILDIQRTGHTLLGDLRKAAPTKGCTDIEKYEAYIANADKTAIRIESLSSSLRGPIAGQY